MGFFFQIKSPNKHLISKRNKKKKEDEREVKSLVLWKSYVDLIWWMVKSFIYFLNCIKWFSPAFPGLPAHVTFLLCQQPGPTTSQPYLLKINSQRNHTGILCNLCSVHILLEQRTMNHVEYLIWNSSRL